MEFTFNFNCYGTAFGEEAQLKLDLLLIFIIYYAAL